jgi:Rod binding domain-containing protein
MPLGGSGFLQEGEQPADLAQRLDRLLAHAQRDPLRRAEQVAEQRDAMRALGLLEQQRRAAARRCGRRSR